MSSKEMSAKEIKQKIMSLRDQVPKEEHEIAGTKVWVHGLTSYDLEGWRLIKHSQDENVARLATAKLLQLAMRDENGARIFQDNEIAIIGGLPAKELEPIARAAARLSGYGIEANKEILKNLLITLGGNGSSEQQESTDVVSPSSVKGTPEEK